MGTKGKIPSLLGEFNWSWKNEGFQLDKIQPMWVTPLYIILHRANMDSLPAVEYGSYKWITTPPWSIIIIHLCFGADTQTWNDQTVWFLISMLLKGSSDKPQNDLDWNCSYYSSTRRTLYFTLTVQFWSLEIIWKKINIYIYTFICIYTHTYIHTYVCMCIYIYVYI